MSDLEFFEIEINEKYFKCYVKRKTNMKNITAKVDNNLDIIVTCDSRIPNQLIYQFIISKKNSIYLLIEKQEKKTFYNPKNNIVSLLGKEHNLVIEKTTSNEKYIIGYRKITFFLKDESNKEKLIRRLFKNESKKYIISRTNELAKIFNFSINKINIKWMVGCWGNCRKSSKNISFSSRLITFPKEIIDYVIIHELCHLIESNHSQNFWDLVSRFCPYYKEARKYLKRF